VNQSNSTNKGKQTMQTITNQSIVLTPDLFALIDHAGALDSEIKALTKQLDAIKTTIKSHGAGDHAGFTFSAKVIDSERVTIDYKAICEKLNPSYQLVTAHTSSAIIQSIRFTKV
jgi:hydroxypyruvate isomerase